MTVNAQQLPHDPWSLIEVTFPAVYQLILAALTPTLWRLTDGPRYAKVSGLIEADVIFASYSFSKSENWLIAKVYESLSPLMVSI